MRKIENKFKCSSPELVFKMFAKTFKLILLALAFELGFRLEQCDWMGLFKGLI